jgi:Protein of unknown function (DUF1176)
LIAVERAMMAPWMMGVAMLGVVAARAEPAPTVRSLFDAAWTRAECNQTIDQSLNNATYHDLGGGYSLGMVLCWLGPRSDSQILFVVAPRTGGRPQLLRFEEWRDGKFQPADALSMAEYQPKTRTITSHRRYNGSGVCGSAGEWTWTGTEFRMTGYWDKPDCKDDSEFERGDRFRVFPPRQ